MGDTTDLLGKLFMAASAPSPARRKSLEEYRRSWEARTTAARRLVERKERLNEGYLPSDEPDAERDVAFGILKKSRRVLSADQVTDEHGQPHKRKGAISHIAMLYAGGYAKSLDDPKPSDDYACRGIVKAKLGGRIIFWEETPELTTARLAPYVRATMEELLKRKLVTPETEVYGANEDVAVATVDDILRDW